VRKLFKTLKKQEATFDPSKYTNVAGLKSKSFAIHEIGETAETYVFETTWDDRPRRRMSIKEVSDACIPGIKGPL
jgi:hypothetical protein